VQSAPPFNGGRPAAPISGPPTSAPPTRQQPPAWPPVAADRDTPHVPESLAAALDMTTELPRYRPNGSTGSQPQLSRQAPPSVSPEAERSAAAAEAAHEVATQQAASAQATAAAQIAAAQAAARQRAGSDGQSQFADETMELTIFRELESAWFMTARPAEPKAGPAAESKLSPVVENDSVSSQRIPTGEPIRSAPPVPPPAPAPAPVAAPAPAPAPERIVHEREPEPVGAVASNGAVNGNGSGPWQTAADDGWQAARAAADMPVDTTTTAGLPRRTPMAQLVPGGVDRAETSVQRRTPESVRGLLSAYHRGVHRGRTKEQSTNPEETPGGQLSSQAGKEHEA